MSTNGDPTIVQHQHEKKTGTVHPSPTVPPHALNGQPPAPYAQPVQYVQPVQYAQPPQMPYMQVQFGPNPQPMTCPQCGVQAMTQVEKEAGLGAWLIAGGLCFFGFCCCAPIPLLIDEFKDTNHRCPACNAMLGSKKLVS